MQKYFPCINPPSEARSASLEARSRSKELRFGSCVVVAHTFALMYMAKQSAGLLSAHASYESIAFVVIGGVSMLAYYGWLLVCLRRSIRARKLCRSVDNGTPCDPRIADPLTVAGISLVTAVERFDAIVRRWKAYEDGVTEEFNLIDRLPDEDKIRDAIQSAGDDLAAYAKRVERHYRRAAVIRELSASMEESALPSFSESFDNLRAAEARLQDPFVLRDDIPPVDSERLLAEPLLMAKLDALDRDLSRIPTNSAQPTNG